MRPESEAELASMVRDAKGPLSIRGGGTRGMAALGEVLSTEALTGIRLYEPGALTLVAAAGTPVAEVEAALAEAGQRLPFEPMDHRALLGTTGTPTLGGMVAANVSGPRRIQAGACRDSLIGVRFVDGHGECVSNGGRVMKNVTGYDLVKLMAGSHGTLGVLTEVSFKLLPAPEAAATLSLEGLDPASAVKALAAALTSPFEVSGAAHWGTRTLVRVEGFAGSVEHRTAQLSDILGAHSDVTVERDPDTVAAIWTALSDVTDWAETPGEVWRVSVKPTDGPELAARVEGADVRFDWGGGLVWLRTEAGQDVRAAMAGMAGHATLVRGSERSRQRYPAFHPEAAPVAKLTQGLRTKFDPRHILNAGLMG
ncbi:MAG: FAD-binding protein [Pseudomonadota bacterium]